MTDLFEDVKEKTAAARAVAEDNEDNFRAALNGLDLLGPLIPGFELSRQDVVDLLEQMRSAIDDLDLDLSSIVEGIVPADQVASVVEFLRLADSLSNLFTLVSGIDTDVATDVTNAVAKLGKVSDFVETVDNFNGAIKQEIVDDLAAIRDVAAGN